jgi:hypothetical protein
MESPEKFGKQNREEILHEYFRRGNIKLRQRQQRQDQRVSVVPVVRIPRFKIRW